MFCLNNDAEKFSKQIKYVELRISGNEGTQHIFYSDCVEYVSLDQDENDLLKDEDVILSRVCL